MKNPAVSLVIGLASAAMLAIAGCATTGSAAAEADAFRAAVDDTFRMWADSSTNPNADLFGSLWDVNAVKMAAGAEPKLGQATIRAARQKKTDTTIYDKFEVKIDEYQLAGEFGWAKGVYTIVTRPRAGGAPLTDVGTFLTVFKRQPDGSWKVYRDTMMPLPTK